MMTEIIRSTSPIDANVADSLVREANAAAFKSKAIGLGAAIGISGLTLMAGVAAIIWASKQGTDPEMLRAVLASMPALRVEGTVKADGEVRIAEGGIVKLDEGATVRLADGSMVTVKGTVPSQTPTQITLPKTKADEDPAIQTSVTVFKTVPHGDGEVVSGWRFPAGNARSPTAEYCYFSRGVAEGNQIRQNIGNARVMEPSAGVSAVEQTARFQKCQWWQGGSI